VNRVCSIFSQLLQLFPRLEFEQLAPKHRAERHARGFTCWGQFIAMLFLPIGASAHGAGALGTHGAVADQMGGDEIDLFADFPADPSRLRPYSTSRRRLRNLSSCCASVVAMGE